MSIPMKNNTEETSSPTDDELSRLNFKRGQIKGQLTRMRNYFTSFDKNSNDILQLKLRLAKFEPIWTEFETLQSQIEYIDRSQAQELERDSFENGYFELLSSIQSFIESKSCELQLNSTIGHEPILPSVKLPIITLPKFNGEYENWSLFCEMFSSMIGDNTSLSTIQKFHYLKTSLTGVAAQVIESLEISSANYELAWSLLEKRFNNKRAIVDLHLRALFEMKPISKETASSLRSLFDDLQKHIRSLKALGLPTDSWDAMIIHLMKTKLDKTTFSEWEIYLHTVSKTELATLTDFNQFLSQRCQILEATEARFLSSSQLAINDSSRTAKRPSVSHVAAVPSCYFCKQNHSIYQCREFLKLSVLKRKAQIEALMLCFNCLKPNHMAKTCSSGHCKLCARKHNTLLHSEDSDRPTQISNSRQAAGAEESTSTTSMISIDSSQTVLATALVHVSSLLGGQSYLCRSLLDSGSESCFISETLCQRLRLKRKRVNVPLCGINQSSSRISAAVTVTIYSQDSSYCTNIECYILSNITQNLPAARLNIDEKLIPGDFKLADPLFHCPQRIDLLIGGAIFWDLIQPGVHPLNNPLGLQLRETRLGWVVVGECSLSRVNHCYQATFTMENDDSSSLDIQLTKFWELESCLAYPKQFVREKNFCERHFIKNTQRDPSGRFLVRLPFVEGVALGNSVQFALKRFYNLERRFEHNKELKANYSEVINEYLTLQHMERVGLLNDLKDEDGHFYLSHHPVIKESSSTTKLRVVFDGSMKSSSGSSLNEALAVGPTIQDDLFSLLNRFRLHRYVLTADIAKMYRQIRVEKSDSDFQRILWRHNTSEPITVYRLLTVTFGTSCAPFLAIRCLQELAHKEQHHYPIASRIVLNDFYVDDLLTGADSLQEALDIRNELISMLAQGGFHLRKWCSNSNSLLNDMHSDMIECQPNIDLGLDVSVKALGLWWNPSHDDFRYKFIQGPLPSTITKRYIISEIAKVFDPLGLIGPVVVSLKIFLQRLWRSELNWDDKMPDSIQGDWCALQSELPLIEQLRIPRFILHRGEHCTVQLHGFCDASEKAYGACIYLRCNSEDAVSINLVCSKSRVAPIKTISLPRLELCAALLLTTLIKRFQNSSKVEINNIHCWSDSKIVLAWLKGSPNKWKTFVANRVTQIQEASSDWSWRHVSTKENPADLLSRGVSPGHLMTTTIWWYGPAWLKCNQVPMLDNDEDMKFTELPELRAVSLAAISVNSFDIFLKYSKFSKLQRVFAYILRFVFNSRNVSSRRFGSLSVFELGLATTN